MDSPTSVPPTAKVARRATRIALFAGILACLVFAHGVMSDFATELPWHRNLDMNIHNADDAMSLNAGQAPYHVDQPGLPPKFLLSLDHRVRHQLGRLPVWNMDSFSAHPDPIAVIPSLIEAGRSHSRHMVLLVMVLAVAFIYQSTRDLSACLIGAALLAGSEGLLFHGMMTRPELLCMALGGIVALGCVVRATRCAAPPARNLWLMVSGLGLGLSVLSKIPGYAYAPLALLWCWFAPLWTERRREDRAAGISVASRVASPIAVTAIAAAAGLTVRFLAGEGQPLDPVAKVRLLTGLGVIVLLAWSSLLFRPGRFGGYARGCIHDSVMLGAGAVATIPACTLLARWFMPAAETADYMEHVLQVVFRPDALVNEYAANPDVSGAVFEFLAHDWTHLALALFTTLLVVANRGVPRGAKALVLLLVAAGLGMLLLMSKRYFTLQYPVFVQVPLMIAVAIGVHAFWQSLPEAMRRRERGWVAVLSAGLLAGLLWGVGERMREDSINFQPNQNTLPQTHPLALIFLYSHDTHTKAYLQTMKNRYPDQTLFIRALENVVNHREE